MFDFIVSKKFVLMIFLLAIFVISFSTVKADSFYPDGDIYDCNFAYTFGFGINSIRSDEQVDFEEAEVNGEYTTFLSTLNIHDIANVSVGSLQRYAVGTSLAVPPGSEISLLFYPYNFTNHSVRVRNSWMFISNNRMENLSSILDVSTKYVGISYVSQGHYYSKKGMAYNVGDLGNWSFTSWKNVPRGKVVKEISVIQPISIEDSEFDCSKESVDVSFLAVNSGRTKEILTMEGHSYEIQANESKTLHLATNNDMLSLIVNEREECFGGSREEDPNNRAFLISRNDYNNWSWGGIQTDIPIVKESIRYCIKRIEYSIPIEIPKCLPAEARLVPISYPDQIYIDVPNSSKEEIILKNIGDSAGEFNVNLELPEEITNKFDNSLNFHLDASDEYSVNLDIIFDSLYYEDLQELVNNDVNLLVYSDQEEILRIPIFLKDNTDIGIEYYLFDECTDENKFEGLFNIDISGNLIVSQLRISNIEFNPSIKDFDFKNDDIEIIKEGSIYSILVSADLLPGNYTFPFSFISNSEYVSMNYGADKDYSVCIEAFTEPPILDNVPVSDIIISPTTIIVDNADNDSVSNVTIQEERISSEQKLSEDIFRVNQSDASILLSIPNTGTSNIYDKLVFASLILVNFIFVAKNKDQRKILGI